MDDNYLHGIKRVTIGVVVVWGLLYGLTQLYFELNPGPKPVGVVIEKHPLGMAQDPPWRRKNSH
jgi:hypothetical protein